MSNRDDYLKKVIEERKKIEKEKKKKEEFRKNGFQFEQINYSALEIERFKIFRILDNLVEVRNGSPYAAKKVYQSRIIGDNDKFFLCNWPSREDNKNWIMWRIFNTVMAYDYDNVSRTKIYKHIKSHPTVFKRVSTNNQDHVYAKGWYPTSYVVMNVIDRELMDWHKENKHSVILSKRGNPDKNKPDVIYYDIGIPISVYNEAVDEISAAGMDNDVAITRLDTQSNPYYKAILASDGFRKYSDYDDDKKYEIFQNKELMQYINRPLTEEELSYEKYDLDKIYKVTSYNKILNRLGDFISQVDKSFNTHYYEELCELADNEKKENNYNNNNEDNNDSSSTTESSAEVPTRNENVAPVRQRNSTSTVDFSVLDKYVNTEGNKRFSGMDKLSDAEKNSITKIIEKDNIVKFEYTDEFGIIQYGCKICKFIAPEKFSHCPDCAKKF